jgi:ABC-type branched-subunit amino acid transport system ATPase component
LTLRIAHRAVVLQNGLVAVQGTSQELLQNPSLRESYLA